MKDKAIDQILDLLLDALHERKQERGEAQLTVDTTATGEVTPAMTANDTVDTSMIFNIEQSVGDEHDLAPADDDIDDTPIDPTESEFEEEIESLTPPPPEKLPSINMNRVFYRLSAAMALLIVLVNIPFNRYGTNLARAMPDEQALIVRDGLLFTGPGDEVYVLEGNQKRWITSLTAFELHGFRWEQVHEVDQAFVDQFEDGADFHVIIRCDRQPHIYLLEQGEKRWIENPTEFERAGLKWEDVRYVSCFKLKNDYPDGVPIPPDAGDPPTW